MAEEEVLGAKITEHPEKVSEKLILADRIIDSLRGVKIDEAMEALEFTKPLLIEMKEQSVVTDRHGLQGIMDTPFNSNFPPDEFINYNPMPKKEGRFARMVMEVGTFCIAAVVIYTVQKALRKP